MIRFETKEDYFEVEKMVRDAFWGQNQPRAIEHYLLHQIRKSPDFVKELSLIYEAEGQIAAQIAYMQSTVVDDQGIAHDVLTFGPLSTAPNLQNKGYGRTLLEFSIEKARKMGYPAILIFGEPDYYPKMGFRPAHEYQIHTADHAAFDAFMVYVLDAEKMASVQGTFYLPDDYQVDEEEVLLFEQRFPKKIPVIQPEISILKNVVSPEVYLRAKQLVKNFGDLHRFSSRELWSALQPSIEEQKAINQLLKTFGYHPKKISGMAPVHFIADNATVVGDITLGKEVTIWFQSVIRGDANSVTIGDCTNIQDGTIIHVDHDAPVEIGKNVTVGHQCMLHGCKIENGALIGMSSVILNHAVIGENSLIGAGSLVTQGMVIPPNVLAFGRPAKVIRTLTTEEIAKNKQNISHYVALGAEYAAGKYPDYRA